MAQRSSGGSSFEETETRLGGADAVPDSVGVAGHGTEPGPRVDGPARAIVTPGHNGVVAWIVLMVSAAILVVYLAGIAAR